jgi:hypothetical protein
MTTGDETYSFNVTVDGGTAVGITIATADNTGGGTTIDLAEAVVAINADLAAAGSDVRARNSTTTAGNLEFFVNAGTHTGLASTIAVGTFANGGTTPTATTGFGFGASASDAGADAVAAGAVKTVDELVTAINGNSSLTGKVKASNDGGKLNIQNLSTDDLTLTGATASAVDGGSGAQTVGGNTVRKNLITQFNDLRTQLDKLAEDASFNGVNLLRGDTLKLVFNETNTSSISIVSQNANGINSTVLGIGAASASEFSSNTALDVRVDALATALTSLRSQASAFGSNLSIVQNRTEFTKAMINTLQTGSDALVLADSNEEAANLLALQTRQQLSTTALSLASQADQAVLRLF